MTFPYALIDLTHTLDETSPSWEEGCGFKHEITLDYDACTTDVAFRVMTFKMPAGIGTHIDAPRHCVPTGLSVDQLSFSQLGLPCFVIDVSAKAEASYQVSLEDIEAFEKEYTPLTPNCCVMIRTGWERFWPDAKKYRNNLIFPSVAPQTAELLLSKGAKALGIDTLSPDVPQNGFKVHKAFLEAGCILIENVAHLSKMPPTGGFVMAFPLKIRGATESPVRLVGFVKAEKL